MIIIITIIIIIIIIIIITDPPGKWCARRQLRRGDIEAGEIDRKTDAEVDPEVWEGGGLEMGGRGEETTGGGDREGGAMLGKRWKEERLHYL